MAAISATDDDSWVVARWAFRSLVERAQAHVAVADDARQLEQAVALDGLHLSLLEPGQAARLASALVLAAAELEPELRAGESDDPRDEQFAEELVRLRALLAVAS